MKATKKRSLYKLYKIVYDEYYKSLTNLNYIDPNKGICAVIFNCYYLDLINNKEFDDLKEHFKKMKPTPFVNKNFYYMEQSAPSKDVFYFTEGNSQIRLKFLKYLIEITKPWYIRWLKK